MPVSRTERVILLSAILTVLSWVNVSSFNLDTKFPITFQGPEKSYFGYTVAMIQNVKGYLVLVGAPRGNLTSYPEIFEPGVLFRCDINSTSCEEVDISKVGKGFPTITETIILYRRWWLGVTLEVRPEMNGSSMSKDIVVCAHRFRDNSYYSIFDIIRGMCYIFDRELRYSTALELKPLDDSSNLYKWDIGTSQYRSYYGNGQLGMSASISGDGSHVIIGAPGIWDGTGSLFYYNDTDDDMAYTPRNVKKPSPQIEPHSYFGYAITAGNFFNSSLELFAVGAPRDENHGKVYIIRTAKKEEMTFLQSIKGFELGEYFGASVLGIDLNGDSNTDLVVGAPLYAHEMGCDEGRVYVYLSDGSKLNFLTELTGDGKSDARFGAAIANTGDLNQDGFGDIAIGAPYEDGKGAVYIYCGSDSGIISQYSQKLEAIKINPGLFGFGIHISRGLDIDENGYPDILVGSYSSSNAVLLRSRPVIEVFLELFFNPPKIKKNKAECLYEGKTLPCVYVDACLKYTAKFAPASLDFQCTLFQQDLSSRGFFIPYRHKNAATQRNVSAKINTETCLTLQFYLHSDVKDVVTPISIQFFCKLAPQAVLNDTFENTFPVVSPFSITNITKEIPFHNGCANDDVCYSDLIVRAELPEVAKHGAITLGTVKSVSIDITVRNEGEPAFLSELLIYLPPQMPIINKDICETINQPEQEVIACELGNPLVKDRQVNIQIKLDITKIPLHTRFLEIFLQGSTNSTEINPADNIVTLALEVQTISDIGIRGIPSHSLILYHEEQEMSSIIKHKYTVRNYGPSPLQTIDFSLQMPMALLNSDRWEPLTYIIGLKTDSDSELTVPAVCNFILLDTEQFLVSEITPLDLYASEVNGENGTITLYNRTYSLDSSVDFLPRTKRMQRSRKERSFQTEENYIASQRKSGNVVISCGSENIECVTLQCSASPFSDVHKFAEISVAFEIDFTVLNKCFGVWKDIEFVTTGSISVSDPDVIHLPHHPEVCKVKTVFLRGIQSHREVPPWLYFAGFSIGSILLLQIVIILTKLGFFIRKEKEMLRRLEKLFLATNIEEELSLDISDTASILN